MKLNMWREFIKILKVAKKEFIFKLIASVFLRGQLLVFPLLFSEAINLATKGDYDKAYLYIGISIAVIVLYRLSEGMNQSSLYKLYNKLYVYYNSLGLKKTNENSMFSLSRFSLGQYTNMLTTDVDIISGFFANLVMRVVQLLEFVIIYAYFLSLDFFIFLSALIISIIVLVLIPLSNKKVKIINENKKAEQDKQVASIHEFFKNIKDIKCFNLFDIIAPRSEKRTKSFLKENANYFITYTWNIQLFLAVFEVFRLLSVGYGIYLITQGQMEIGALLIIYNYYQKIIDNYFTILTMSVEYTNLKVSLERFNHLVEFSLPKSTKKGGAEQITDGRIVFENILYGYKNDPSLNNVSFEFEPNTLTAITGKAGSGKSCIFDLLLKLNRQHQGTITIDGHEIKDIDDEEYFSKISSLNKNSSLFEMSIKDNLLLVEPNEEKIIEICQKLDIHDEIMSLKDGYDTIVEDNGNLTSTLNQMLIIARTILKGSKIMLLNEALIGLDENKQNKIIELLFKLKQDHTIVMITHDKDVLKRAEKIIVLDNRKVAEIGTLKQLINNKGVYYRLYESEVVS